MPDKLTIFEETARELARTVQEAALDFEAFEIPLKVCVLADCRATCCHDGVILGSEEARILRDLGREEDIVQDGKGRWRTRLREAREEELSPDFPAHFHRTKCVFLDDQDRCQWQLRAVEEGRHPWFYKPISCWMHPVLLASRNDRPHLTLLEPKTDDAQFGSQTPCGRACEGGAPARVTLDAELKMLGSLSGRNLLGELNAPSI